MGIKDNVLEVFWKVFWSEVDKWIEDGEQLVLEEDWTTDVTKGNFLEDLQKRELLPAMSSIHGKKLTGNSQQWITPN